MIKENYNYEELRAEYKGIDDFYEGRPDYEKENFEICYEEPYAGGERDEYLNAFFEHLDKQNEQVKFGMMTEKPKKFYDDKYKNCIGGLDDIDKLNFDFGLRELVSLDFSRKSDNLEVHLTSYFDFIVGIIENMIGNRKSKLRNKYGGNTKKISTSFFGEEKNKLWMKSVLDSYKQLLGKEFDINNIDKEKFIDAFHKVFLTRTKMAYSGFLKEKYSHVALLTNDLVKNGQILVYRPNKVGDGIGIDFLIKNQNGVWATVAITNTGEKSNDLCNISFKLGSRCKINFYGELRQCEGKQVKKNSWIYLPENEQVIDGVLVDFAIRKVTS